MDLALLGITVDLNFVILGVLAYAVGLVSVMAYSRLRTVRRDRYRADDAIVEAVVQEYTRRLRDYDRVIAEMRAKVDIAEARINSFSQPHYVQVPVAAAMSQPPQPHTQTVSEPVTVTQRAPAVIEEKFEGQNGTTDYILKLLAERARTSREVQHAVGRTREHTARLMKKLHDSGLVSRDLNSKPFRYTITEAGRARLREKPAQLAQNGMEQTAV
jgi:CRP-like cAMP-binding protein